MAEKPDLLVSLYLDLVALAVENTTVFLDDFEDGVGVCDEQGCISIYMHDECDDYGYKCERKPKVKRVGIADGAEATLIILLSDAINAVKKYLDTLKKFEKGKATLTEALKARDTAERAIRKLVRATDKANKTYQSLYEPLTGPEPTSDPCRDLINAINAVIDHPEG